jgi:hypothetical protein
VSELDEALSRREHATRAAGTQSDRQVVQLGIEHIRARFRRPSDFSKLTLGEQLVFRVAMTMDAEMLNGGIDQYLRNESGRDAQQVRADLARIGAEKTLAVLDGAVSWFQNGVIPSDPDERFDQLVAAEAENPDQFD